MNLFTKRLKKSYASPLGVGLFFLSTIFTSLQAQVYVDHSATGANDGSSWNNAYTDLQDAMNQAPANEDIWVAKGTYTPTQLFDIFSYGPEYMAFHFDKNLNIYGGFAGTETALNQRNITANPTILDGEDVASHILVVVGTNNASINGISFIRGNADHSNESNYAGQEIDNNYGASIYLAQGQLTVNECSFTDNYSGYGGGAIYARSNSNLVVNDSEFEDNETYYYGGAIYTYNNTEAHITNSTFTDNYSGEAGGAIYHEENSLLHVNNSVFNSNDAYYYGGGIFTYESELHVTGSSFTENYVEEYGASIYLEDAIASTIDQCLFDDNYAEYECGGIYCDGATVDITNSNFTNNYGDSYGAAIFIGYSSNTNVTNCSFSNNSGDDKGGAIANYRDVNPIITNCSFANNTTDDEGDCIYNYDNAHPTFINCIFWGNGEEPFYNDSADNTMTFQNCIIQDDSEDGSVTMPENGIDAGGNLDSNPLFTDVPNNDLTVLAGSPAINAGDSAANPLPTDIAGNERISGSNIDMGAYESPSCESAGLNSSTFYIHRVRFINQNNTTGNDGGYGDHTDVTFNANAGQNCLMMMKPGAQSGAKRKYWKVWIDWNDDEMFDASELVIERHSSFSLARYFKVPNNAPNGAHKMRISMSKTPISSPCEDFAFGEVEDYTLNINGGSGLAQADSNPIAETIPAVISTTNDWDLAIFPNPAQEFVNIELPVFEGNAQVSIYSTLGQKVWSKTYNNSTVMAEIALDNTTFSTGTYIVEIVANNTVSTKNFTISK